MSFIPVMQVYPRFFVPPWCLEYTVRLTGQCVPVPLLGTVFKGVGTVITFGPMVLPMQNPKIHPYAPIHTRLQCSAHTFTPHTYTVSVMEFVGLHNIPYIFLSPNSQPYLSIDEFLASPDRDRNLSEFVPNASFP